MKLLFKRCAALDVHKASVTVCARIPGPKGTRAELVRTVETMTPDLLALRDWLRSLGVTHVAMEATGVDCRPVYYLLEDEFQCLLCNAQHVERVPGRKTDVSDAQWLCELLEHGLLRSSFVPPKPIRELRDLTRYRKALVNERAREANRLHKGARGRRHQALLRRLRRARRLRTGDAGGARGRQRRSRAARRPRQGQVAAQAAGARAGASPLTTPCSSRTSSPTSTTWRRRSGASRRRSRTRSPLSHRSLSSWTRSPASAAPPPR